MTDERTLLYIKKCLDAGRMSEAIETSEIAKVGLSKEELKNYIYKYLENGWVSKAIEGSKAAGIELSKETLTNYINKYLDEGRIYSANEASRIIGFPLPKEKIIIIGRECFLKGKLNPGLEAYKLVKENPPVEELIICGGVCFKEGQFYSGLEAYKLANKKPPEEELIVCGNKCFNTGQTTPGLEAYELANKTPTKEILRVCGEICLIEKRIDEARKALVASQKIEENKDEIPIDIKEISRKEIGSLKEIDESLKSFGPGECLDCENMEEFKERFFLLSRCPETGKEEEWLDKTMKEKYGVEHYAVGIFRGNKGLIGSAVCERCGSQNVSFESRETKRYIELKK
jgi:hypothetical protein